MRNDAFKLNEQTGIYEVTRPITSGEIIQQAKQILSKHLHRGPVLTNPEVVRNYLITELAAEEREIFCCLFLDNQHRVLRFEKMFFGTIDGAAVYPRVVAQKALKLNAAAVIFSHNHPSGITKPSNADKQITQKLKEALSLIDIRVLDHFIIGGSDTYSFAEFGLI